MTTTNHILAGSVIAASITNPWLAIALAFMSHFLLDALPHFGYANNHGWTVLLKNNLSRFVIGLDAIGTLFLVAFLLPQHLWILAIGFIALSPDFLWPIRYFLYERNGHHPTGNAFTRFHTNIQRYERPWGLAVEIAFFSGMIFILARLLA